MFASLPCNNPAVGSFVFVAVIINIKLSFHNRIHNGFLKGDLVMIINL